MPKVFFGRNEMKSRSLFESRKLYGKFDFGEFETFDLWNGTDTFVGRLDYNHLPVIPSQGFLKQIPSGRSMYFCMSFVADAYLGWREHYRRALEGSKVLSVGNLQAPEIKKGWISFNDTYHSLMTNLYEAFYSVSLKNVEITKEIDSFEFFLEALLSYLEKSKIYPITKTGYIMSRFYEPALSGLVLEIQQKNHGNDSIKEDQFIDDPNFVFYIDSLRKFGFRVDKNAPWRIIADIANPKMKEYIIANDIDPNNLFKIAFYRTSEQDLDSLKIYLIQFYNSFVSDQPHFKKCPTGKTFYRTQISKFYQNDKFWLEWYVRLRIYETEI